PQDFGCYLSVLAHRYDNQLCGWHQLPEPLSRFKTVQHWHAQVQQNYVRSQLLCFFQQPASIRSGANNLKLRFQQFAERFCNQRVIIRQKDSRPTHTRTPPYFLRRAVLNLPAIRSEIATNESSQSQT